MEAVSYTWSSLSTVAGATAATMLIVEYIKEPLDRVIKLPTRAVVLVIAFLILLAAQLVTDKIHSFTDVLLTLVNAFVVALAAIGAHDGSRLSGKV